MKDNNNKNNKIGWDQIEYREFPDAAYEFLRCQAGVTEHVVLDVTKQLSDGTWPNRRRFEQVPIFHLIGYGETMDQANEMAERVILRKAA